MFKYNYLASEKVNNKAEVGFRSGGGGLLYYQVERHLRAFCYSFQFSYVMRKFLAH